MSLIFISYRRNDVPGHTGRLFSSLATTYPREKIFLDTDSIGIGEQWSARIQDAVDRSVVFLCLIGPQWNVDRLRDPNDVVRREISAAISKDRAIIPILYDGARYPSREELPDDCQAMSDIQGIVFDPSDFELYEAKLKRLPSIIDGLVARLFAAGNPAAECRLCIEGTSNRGEGGVSIYVDDTRVDYVKLSGRIKHYIKFPVGWRTVRVSERIMSVSRMSGSTTFHDRTVASYRLFFEAAEYVAQIERYQFPWPLELYDRYKFHEPMKRSREG
jgi:hypothetical protein